MGTVSDPGMPPQAASGGGPQLEQGRDGWIDEIAIGQCAVCSYTRTSDVADDIAQGIQLKRIAESPD